MRIVCFIFVIVNVVRWAEQAAIGENNDKPSVINMYENEPDIEVLDKSTFDATVYGSDKATFVEFYAHWCGACRRYKPLMIELAKTTKTWHSRVMRFSVINCGDSYNDNFCRKHNIGHYPTLKMFPAGASYDEEADDKGATVVDLDSAKNIIHKMIDMIEKQTKKPDAWPDLEAFSSKRLDTIFVKNRESKFAMIIVENDSSYLGKKLILDFSAYSDRITIRRATPSTNPTLMSKLEIDERKLPQIYLVNNTSQYKIVPERLTQSLLETYKKNLKLNQQQTVDFDIEEEKNPLNDDDEEDIDPKEKDERIKFSKLIRNFIKLNNLLTNEEAKNHQDHVNAAQLHAQQVKKDQVESYLQNVQDKVYMIDLESGLNYLLRSDIPSVKLITGDKMKALKEWIRVLAKYFPGRKPVRNYLKNLNDKLNSSQVVELTGNQWKIIADENTPKSFLPDKTEWKHCRGSQPQFRGYPCSLWTLFHVLTVNQIEVERSKPSPFEELNVSEVIEAIRNVVSNFFTCRECAENFLRETKDYKSRLNKPYDTVEYLWQVHNSVNKRLANDHITEQDPKFPKEQFPTRTQCPKCYLATVKNVEELAEHESPWNMKEILLFVTSYFSKYRIEAVDAVDVPVVKIEPQIPDAMVDNDGGKVPRNEREALEIEEERLVKIRSKITEQGITDLKLSSLLIFIAILVFGCMFIYFNFNRRKFFKTKKHII